MKTGKKKIFGIDTKFVLQTWEKEKCDKQKQTTTTRTQGNGNKNCLNESIYLIEID